MAFTQKKNYLHETVINRVSYETHTWSLSALRCAALHGSDDSECEFGIHIINDIPIPLIHLIIYLFFVAVVWIVSCSVNWRNTNQARSERERRARRCGRHATCWKLIPVFMCCNFFFAFFLFLINCINSIIIACLLNVCSRWIYLHGWPRSLMMRRRGAAQPFRRRAKRHDQSTKYMHLIFICLPFAPKTACTTHEYHYYCVECMLFGKSHKSDARCALDVNSFGANKHGNRRFGCTFFKMQTEQRIIPLVI